MMEIDSSLNLSKPPADRDWPDGTRCWRDWYVTPGPFGLITDFDSKTWMNFGVICEDTCTVCTGPSQCTAKPHHKPAGYDGYAKLSKCACQRYDGINDCSFTQDKIDPCILRVRSS